MAGVWRGAFTCVGWQVTLCDPIWQVTSRSSEMGFPVRAISAFTFPFNKRAIMQFISFECKLTDMQYIFMFTCMHVLCESLIIVSVI